MSLALSGKEVRDTHSTIYNLVKKIVKIGPVDPEIIGLQSKKKKFPQARHRPYSLVGTHAERAK